MTIDLDTKEISALVTALRSQRQGFLVARTQYPGVENSGEWVALERATESTLRKIRDAVPNETKKILDEILEEEI